VELDMPNRPRTEPWLIDPESRTSAGDPLDAVIADYVQQVEAGNVPDRKPLLCSLVPKDGQGEAGILTRY
jgi:hypothetical protein